MRCFAASALALAMVLAAPPARADLDAVRQRGKLRVLAMLEGGEPQFFSIKPGTPPGFDHEVVAGFAGLQRLKLEIVPVSSWDGLVPALLGDRGDIIAGTFTATESRRKLIDFTVEVFPTRNVVLTRRPHRLVKTMGELAAERIGIVKGTSQLEALVAAGVPASSIDDSIPSGVGAAPLRSTRVTAIVVEVHTAIKEARADPDVQIGMFLGPPASLAYGVRKGDTALLQALNEYVLNMRRTPTWSRLVVKYFGEAGLEILKKARE